MLQEIFNPRPSTAGKWCFSMALVEETFGEIVKRLLPDDKALAALGRAAEMDYSYLHGVIEGRRPPPSYKKVTAIISALRKTGATVKPEDAAALLDRAAKLPEGYRVVAETNTSYKTQEADLVAQRLVETYHSISPQGKRFMEEMAEAVRRSDDEGVIGRRPAEEDAQQGQEDAQQDEDLG